MIRGLYNATAALQAASQAHDAIATNLAHASVPGYRRRVVTQASFDSMLPQASTGQATPPKPMQVATHVVFEQGQTQHTGNQLDVALQGDGFFAFQGPRGPVYSRNGAFQINAEGTLLSSGGLPVLGPGNLPPGYSKLTIQPDGTILADGAAVGQLQIAHFQDPTRLVPVGTTMFEAPPGAQPVEGNTIVTQGMREFSNVSVVTELIQMIVGMRQYEASQRVLRAISDAVQLNTNPRAG